MNRVAGNFAKVEMDFMRLVHERIGHRAVGSIERLGLRDSAEHGVRLAAHTFFRIVIQFPIEPFGRQFS